MAKAEQFLAAAEVVRALSDEHAEVSDAFVTLCVHGGIAACDVICRVRLGRHAQGENHNEAVALVKTAARTRRNTSPPCSGSRPSRGTATPVTTAEFTRAGRAAEALLEAARRAHASSRT